MKLSELINGIECEVFGRDEEISGIEYDSRKIKPGDIFVALKGTNSDGNCYIDEALSSGASVVLSDEFKKIHSTLVVAKDIVRALALIGSKLNDNPDKKLLLIGITGTNGKTTISYFIENIFKKAGKSPGVIGTINYRYSDKILPAANTTPLSSDIYRIFGDMVKKNCKSCIVEVSSHALAQGRVYGIEFDIAIFTNLTQDHLDFHKTMDEYFAAKSKIFTSLKNGIKTYPKFAIINTDDLWGKKLVAMIPRDQLITYGLKGKPLYKAENIRIGAKGTEFILVSPNGRRKMYLPQLGQHNLLNCLASVAAASSAGISLETIVEAMERTPQVPGRLEKIDAGQPFTVVVDYAHTDDALKNVISALRALKPERLITVFGCGGDRDRSKRPLMGEVATALSDYVFVTSDNPRTEDPQRIALDIEVGIRRKHRNNYQVIVEREQAIAAAIRMAQKRDIILIAGKGHETYQIIGKNVIHFNDSEIAKKYLNIYKQECVDLK